MTPSLGPESFAPNTADWPRPRGDRRAERAREMVSDQLVGFLPTDEWDQKIPS